MTLSAHIQKPPPPPTSPAPPSLPVGRWTWTRGKLRSVGGRSQPPLLPWTSEHLNTSPSTYDWVADRPFIEVHIGGMYAIACAVFVPGAPTIGVTVNGQAVLRRVTSSRQIIDTSGLIAGQSLRDGARPRPPPPRPRSRPPSRSRPTSQGVRVSTRTPTPHRLHTSPRPHRPTDRARWGTVDNCRWLTVGGFAVDGAHVRSPLSGGRLAHLYTVRGRPRSIDARCACPHGAQKVVVGRRAHARRMHARRACLMELKNMYMCGSSAGACGIAHPQRA